MSDLNRRVRASVRVTLAGTVVNGMVQAASMVVLARLLGPMDYGFFVVALSVNAMSCAFVVSTIERAMVLERDKDALWGRSLVIAALLTIIACLTFGVVAAIRALTGWQVDMGVLALVLISQPLAGVGTPVRAWLRRELRFVPLVLNDVGALIFGNFLTAATCAYLGLGAYSLGMGFLMQAIVSAAWMQWHAPAGMMRPRLGKWGDLPRTFWGVVKPTSLEAAHGQISPVVVSWLLGAVQLGLFNRVYNLVTLPVQLLISSASRVMISALAAVADDRERLCRAARLIVRMAAALVTPLTLGLAGSGNAFVAIVLGVKWTSAVPIVPMLAVAVWGNMIGSLLAQLAEATRQFDAKVRIQAFCTISLIALLFAGGLGWGLLGVAAGAMAAALIFAGCYVWLTARILTITLRTVIGWMTPGLVAGIGSFAIARLAAWLLMGRSLAEVLTFQIVGCGFVSALVIAALDKALLLEISRLMLPARLHAVLQRKAFI